MSVMDGCESKYRTPVPEDRICPKCGKEVEVFTVKGKIKEDTACSCGYVFKEEEQ
jgi:rubredoxin